MRPRFFFVEPMRFWLFIALLAGCFSAAAQDWPARPVKFVAPFPPGGSLDTLARLFGGKLGESLKQQFIVENRSGASGIVGTGYAAKSAPDGYTFVFVFDTHSVNPFLNPNLPYDTLRDLAPVTLIGTAPMVIATAAAKPFRNFADVIDATRAKPQGVTLGHVGIGSIAHLSAILLNQQAGIRLALVP
jgi:tripartite-type tricarboxylate transporter receptor subunit TctC